MLKKRLFVLIFTVLSLFISTLSVHAGWFGKKDDETESAVLGGPRLKIYMPYEKAEPKGELSKKNPSVLGGTADATVLYDGNTDKNYVCDTDTTVTLDMGEAKLLSQIRYYAGKVDKNGGNNCLGTRFYASNDNRNFTELGVIENAVAPQENWYEINFSGFGEYRYFRAEIPANSNISEIEWMETKGFSQVKQRDGRIDVRLTLTAFDAVENLDATVFVAAYNKNGILKQISSFDMEFPMGKATNFDAVLEGVKVSEGDSYRVIVFEKNGEVSMKNPLNYRANGAAAEFSVSTVFSDNMIIQADKPAYVWGKAPRGSEVELSLENSLGGSVKTSAKADNNCDWIAQLGSFSSGGEYTMKVRSGGVVKEYKNITFGDVWLCTGQSNMDYYMSAGAETAADLTSPEVDNPNIRLFNLWNKGYDGAAAPIDNPPGGEWQPMNSDVAAYCTAVGYYFAQDIQKTTGEPVGIINVAVGDTEINRWIAKGTKCGSFTSTDGDLYNNRIRPFEKLAIKGIILYQGEADQYRTHLSVGEYRDAMSGLVDIYRKVWGADLPFYWAQLTRYRVDETLVREGQRLALQKISEKKHTGMIVLNDLIGHYDADTGSCRNDIHPWGKKTVAKRFAAYAKRDCYEGTEPVSGPIFESAKADGDKLVLSFECSGKLRLMSPSQYADKQTDEKIKKEGIDINKPHEFEIAGADKVFHKADATLDEKTVILKSDEVSAPMYARYAWGAYPEMPNLTDDTGLPVATFSTEKYD